MFQVLIKKKSRQSEEESKLKTSPREGAAFLPHGYAAGDQAPVDPSWLAGPSRHSCTARAAFDPAAHLLSP
jgi:hypothetical protein